MATLAPISSTRIDDFYRAHAPAVRAFLVSLCRDRTWADDLTQDTFVKATRALAGYRGGDPRSWLFAIARTVFIDATRRRNPTPAGSVLDEGRPARDVAERMLIDEVLATLPPRQRTALLLVDEAGLTYGEAADALDTTLGALKVLVHRARTTFRARYSEMTADD